MLNAGIFGFYETIVGTVHERHVDVYKKMVRTVFDAGVPPGQAVEFEFFLAGLPIEIGVHDQPADVFTRQRRLVDGIIADINVLQAEPRDNVFPVVVARQKLDDFIDVGGLDFDSVIDEPPPPEPPPEPPDFVVPFEITLTPPNGLTPVVFTNPMDSAIRSWPTDLARLDPDFIERAKGKWRISVKNINQDARRMQVVVRAVHAIAPIGHRDIPFSLLNNMAEVALQKTLPTIEYDSGNLVVSTPTQFLELFGIDRTFSLGSTVAKWVDDLPTFTPDWVRLMSRADFLTVLAIRRNNIRSEFQEHITEARNSGNEDTARYFEARMNTAIDACEDAAARLAALPQSHAAFCIVLEGMFTNPDVDLRYIGTVAEVENKLPQIGLVFSEDFRFTEVISNLSIDLSPLLIKIAVGLPALTLVTALVAPLLAPLVFLGGVVLFSSIAALDVEEMLRAKIRAKGHLIAQYVKRAMERLTDVGAVAIHGRIRPAGAADGSDSLHVQYFNPSISRPPRPWSPAGDELSGTSGSAEVVELGAGQLRPRPVRAVTYVAQSGDRTAPYVQQLTRVARETPGPMPEDFLVPGPDTLPRLDDHDCIAVVMMENRSYGHFFHELPLAHPDRGYRQTPARYRNVAPPGFTEPFTVVGNTSIGIGKSLIFHGGRTLDPSHNWDHTHFQVGGGIADTEGSGQMRAFAMDFALKSDSPQIVMSYFSIDDLPVYRGLARHYPVCDRWFAALPVGTFPNRLAALQGNVPFLYNIYMDNAALGYLEDYSILDLLNTQEISWVFFESDIGTARLYDRFRLDVNNVRPFKNFEWMMSTYAQANAMPRVMFIEPQFLFGNDDHPPMSVDGGQEFLRYVVGTFIKYNLLHRTLFVITYDEHGGFFDHVPPPGTPAAVSSGSDYGSVESLFPQGPDAPKYLGVRVPSLVLSKWALARANHTVLDHTAILKTILLHNRNSISTEQFGRFGQRVKNRGHLGQVLDARTARPIDYAAVAADIGYAGVVPAAMNAVVSTKSIGMTGSHPANVLRGIALPRGRTMFV